MGDWRAEFQGGVAEKGGTMAVAVGPSLSSWHGVRRRGILFTNHLNESPVLFFAELLLNMNP